MRKQQNATTLAMKAARRQRVLQERAALESKKQAAALAAAQREKQALAAERELGKKRADAEAAKVAERKAAEVRSYSTKLCRMQPFNIFIEVKNVFRIPERTGSEEHRYAYVVQFLEERKIMVTGAGSHYRRQFAFIGNGRRDAEQLLLEAKFPKK